MVWLFFVAALAGICIGGCKEQDLSSFGNEKRREGNAPTPLVSATGSPAVENSIGMRLVPVLAGDFVMGTHNENNTFPVPEDFVPHHVVISKSFWIGAFEVTQGQYERVMGGNPSWRPPGPEDAGGAIEQSTEAFPVQNVTWYEAEDFCKRLTSLPEERAAGRQYRLPTEAEWEFACRERSSRPFVFMHGRDETLGYNAGKTKSGKRNLDELLPLTSVGSYPPNTLGIYDMRGNVWEWCSDWFAVDYYKRSPERDPAGPDWGLLRVVRGNDWVFLGIKCNFTQSPMEPWRKSPFVGFRVACDAAKPRLAQPNSVRRKE